MGIKNLPVQLNSAGLIKIGVKGEMVTSSGGVDFRKPQKLDHFLITTTERDENGDFIVDTELQNKILKGGTGRVNAAGNLIGIPIRLLYNDTDDNFPTQYACYASGKLVCSGDGEKSKKRLDDFTKEHPCPCARIAPGYEGKDRCKPTGKLTCIIDEAGLFGQAHTFRTTSMNSVRGILGGLELLKTATKGRLAGLPLMLTMNAKQTQTPSGAPTTVFVVSICYRGSMTELRQEVLTILAQEKQYLIGMDDINTTTLDPTTVGIQPGSEEEKEFVEEFFPDAVVIDESTIKTVTKIVEDTDVHSKRQGQEQEENKDKEREEGGQGNQVTDDPADQDREKDDPAPNNGSNGKCLLVGRLFTSDVDGSSYAILYNKFMILLQDDKREEAAKVANRLTVQYLKTWFRKEQPQVVLPEGIKKPELLAALQAILEQPGPVLSHEAPVQVEPDPVVDPATTTDTGEDEEQDSDSKVKVAEEVHPFISALSAMGNHKDVADAVSGFFEPVPINRTLDIPNLIAMVSREIERRAAATSEKETAGPVGEVAPAPAPQEQPKPEQPDTEPVKPAEKFPRAFDAESGPVKKEQLRYLVQLKANLEKQKLLVPTPQAWLVCVSYFLGENGKPLDTAKNLTSAQCETLIKMLELQLEKQEELIPF